MPELNFDLDPGLGETMRMPGSKGSKYDNGMGTAHSGSTGAAVMKQNQDLMMLMEH